MGLGPKIFTRKNGSQKGGKLYKWSPGAQDKRGRKSSSNTSNYFCTTTIGTQGNDFITTYSYVIVVLNGVAQREAYVQCDYVK